MKREKWMNGVDGFAGKLEAIDYESLPVSDYNKQYIRRLRPAFRYFLRIYALCFREGLQAIRKEPGEVTLIDYGGGCGFLSLFAKAIGFGRVVYVDHNPLSVATVTALRGKLGFGPDEILEGTSAELLSWCRARQIKPQLLISTDVIEHVYDLSLFFRELTALENLYMIFTTGSTPYNPYVRKRLETRMRSVETGKGEQPNFFTQRLHFIRSNYPSLPETEAEQWAHRTRGLIYAYIPAVVEGRRSYFPPGPYNTCDPETGNWEERILSLEAYRDLLAPYGYEVRMRKGFYNEERTNAFLSFACRCINALIRVSGKAGFCIAPFITIQCKKKGWFPRP
ncbi:SAM-dependent methyltransferase [Parabacteroides sp. Marseille-P3160]|uniref:SAM-dependent methyltransferase n=1 Tax=Parabacteroides sp. Marseille-P3160 TaxID=1917887 RepID=UPI0009BAC060|nr:SAM-dependent methyltransferase [Parabacteroides sp. Marseille-P3160]